MGVGPLLARYRAAIQTRADGDIDELQMDSHGNLKVTTFGSAGSVFTNGTMSSDGQANPSGEFSAAMGYLFNGTNWDRQRNNQDGLTAGITAAGVTTTQTGADQTNYNARGVLVVLDMTVVGTGSVTIAIQGKDTVSGKYYALLTGAVVSTNSTNLYQLYPGVTVAANAAVSSPLPRTWRIVVTANNANATTYTVGASLIL